MLEKVLQEKLVLRGAGNPAYTASLLPKFRPISGLGQLSKPTVTMGDRLVASVAVEQNL